MLTYQNISFEDDLDWSALISNSKTATFFQTKEWLQIWSKHFPSKPKVFTILDGDKTIGIVPLDDTGGKINFWGVNSVLGNQFVSDFGDIITAAGREKEVWETLVKEIRVRNKELGIDKAEFNFVRENSQSLKILQDIGGKIDEVDRAPYLELPATWDQYLLSLDRHDRHELRRKMRKGDIEDLLLTEFSGKEEEIDLFLNLMSTSNEQKRDFLSTEMREFFRDIINHFCALEKANLTFLKIGDKTIAGALTFHFKDEVLLYNSGIANDFIHLSPGFILIANLIKRSIEDGKKRFDFLRGGERYKYDFGAKERKLYKISF